MKPLKRLLLFGLGFMVGIATFEFCRANWNYINLRFLNFETVPIPLWSVGLGALVLGLALPVLISVLGQFSRARERGQLIRRVKQLESELNNLRNIAIDGPRVLDAERGISRSASKPAAKSSRAMDDDKVLKELGLLESSAASDSD